MEHITTFTGEDFTPLNPDINQIKIEALATRAGYPKIYSWSILIWMRNWQKKIPYRQIRYPRIP